MVENMKYVNITGPIDDLDRVVDEYLSRYDIQLEDAVNELGQHKEIQPFQTPNPYSATLSAARKLLAELGIDMSERADTEQMSVARAVELIKDTQKHYDERSETVKDLSASYETYKNYMELFGHYTNLGFAFEKLKYFEFIGCRFGRMPISSFRQFEAFLYDDQDVLFVVGRTEGENIWAIYFVPDTSQDKLDSVFASLHFERVDIPYELDGVSLEGTPAQICSELKKKLDALENEIKSTLKTGLPADSSGLLAAYRRIDEVSHHYDARKHAGRSPADFYIFVGWMSEKDAKALGAELEHDERVVFIIEEDNDAIVSEAPTRLRNNPVFRPFEFFVRMYGLPCYGELDPTPFVAITYTLIFGLMFGDLGQGAVLSALGWYLYLRKKIALGAVMGIIGVSSMVFGCLYGSVFGIEDILPAIWLRPAESINDILFFTVGMGIVLIAMVMLLNLANALRRRAWGEFFLSANGVAGLAFYFTLVFGIYSLMTGTPAPGFLPPLAMTAPVLIAVHAIREARAKDARIKPAQLVLETVIELFEIVLSYFTNTVSFVRIGAFALSHAGMMSVVLMLSESAGGHNPFVLIAGNVFVICLEGLVVGIQALRLEFYEMFSRFFKGSGREFVAYRNRN